MNLLYKKYLTKNLIKKPILYIALILILWALIDLLISKERDHQLDIKFFTLGFSGLVSDLDKDIKGAYSVKVNGIIYDLSIYGLCIKKISVGDSIIKKANSFKIEIKENGINHGFIQYECYSKKKIHFDTN